MKISMDSVIRRNFHKQLRSIRSICKSNDLQLFNWNNATENSICVISSDEYQTGENIANCDPEQESYFLSPHDYEVYCDLID